MDLDGWTSRSIPAGTSLRMAGMGATALVALATGPARAHDDAQWIMDQRLRNQVGEWCCGKGDCNAVEASGFRTTSGGYQLSASGETIPYSQAMPLSVDGRLWVCRRPNGSIRCVFDRPPGS